MDPRVHPQRTLNLLTKFYHLLEHIQMDVRREDLISKNSTTICLSDMFQHRFAKACLVK